MRTTTKRLRTSRAAMNGKKLSHIEKMRVQFACNHHIILNSGIGLSENDYEDIFFETGCLLLEEMLGEGTDAYRTFSRKKKLLYWKWFKAEFKVLENDFVNVLMGGEIKLTMDLWLEFMRSIPTEELMVKSFGHFVNSLNNG